MQVNIQNMSNTNLNKEYVSPMIQVTYLNTKCCLLGISGRRDDFGLIKNNWGEQEVSQGEPEEPQEP